MDAIACTGLGKRYGRIAALEGLEMSVPRGSVFGFLGANGAGKSTTMNILATLSRPTSGDAWVDGVSVTRHPERVRRALGYLPQGPGFPGWMRGREFLEFAGGLCGVGARERRARAGQLLETVGLGPDGDRPIRGYSGGMKARLGLAQALLHRPSVVILDEPVAALDPLGRRDVLEIIAQLRGSATVFFSSHILDDVDRVCDAVAIIARGRLVVQEATTRLKDRYARPIFVIEVAGSGSALAGALAGQPWVTQAAATGSEVRVTVHDVRRAEYALPRLVLDRGETLLRYEQQLPTLEDIFLRLVEERPDLEEAG